MSTDLETTLETAFDAGYRHFQLPANEPIMTQFGNVLTRWCHGGLIREELYVSLKLLKVPEAQTVKATIAKYLKQLKCSWLDLVLLPCDYKVTTAPLKEFHDLGKPSVRCYGLHCADDKIAPVDKIASLPADLCPDIVQMDYNQLLHSSHGDTMRKLLLARGITPITTFTPSSLLSEIQTGSGDRITERLRADDDETLEQVAMRYSLEKNVPVVYRCEDFESIYDSFQVYTFTLEGPS